MLGYPINNYRPLRIMVKVWQLLLQCTWSWSNSRRISQGGITLIAGWNSRKCRAHLHLKAQARSRVDSTIILAAYSGQGAVLSLLINPRVTLHKSNRSYQMVNYLPLTPSSTRRRKIRWACQQAALGVYSTKREEIVEWLMAGRQHLQIGSSGSLSRDNACRAPKRGMEIYFKTRLSLWWLEVAQVNAYDQCHQKCLIWKSGSKFHNGNWLTTRKIKGTPKIQLKIWMLTIMIMMKLQSFLKERVQPSTLWPFKRIKRRTIRWIMRMRLSLTISNTWCVIDRSRAVIWVTKFWAAGTRIQSTDKTYHLASCQSKKLSEDQLLLSDIALPIGLNPTSSDSQPARSRFWRQGSLASGLIRAVNFRRSSRIVSFSLSPTTRWWLSRWRIWGRWRIPTWVRVYRPNRTHMRSQAALEGSKLFHSASWCSPLREVGPFRNTNSNS